MAQYPDLESTKSTLKLLMASGDPVLITDLRAKFLDAGGILDTLTKNIEKYPVAARKERTDAVNKFKLDINALLA